MNEKYLIPTQINPLSILEFHSDSPHCIPLEKLTLDKYLTISCRNGVQNNIASIKLRYEEITSENEPNFIPVIESFMEKIIWTMRDAKVCYMLGNNFGTISISGMVTEMITKILYEAYKISKNNHPISEEDEKKYFKNTFEKTRSQKLRLKILHEYGILNDEIFEKFESIREKRNEYTHGLDHDWSNIRSDASDVYDKAIHCINYLTSQSIKDESVNYRIEFAEYLVSKGLMVE